MDWKDWSTSFDNILTQEATISNFEDISHIPYNKVIDSIFKEEIDLNNFIVESKVVMDARWIKATQDLQEAKTIE